MSSVSSPAALPQYIASLLSERQQHVADIATIDATLARVTAALGGAAKPVIAKPSPTKQPKNAAKAAPVKPALAAKAPARKPAKPGITANELVLNFIAGKKSATTQEIKKHWTDSARLGTADNILSQLTKAKKLKRSPLAGGLRGSRYTVA